MKEVIYRYTNAAIETINHLLWPARCVSCDSFAQEQHLFLCADCWQELMGVVGGDYCRCCGREISPFALIEYRCGNCRQLQTDIEALARTGLYDGPLRNIILSYKNGNSELAKYLGKFARAALQSAHFRKEIDIFVPVPLHWSRKLSRGYNQSELLAGILTKEYPRKLRPKISKDLVRIRRTPSQPTMATDSQRAANVAGAFAVRPGHKLTGKTVCLVDDVRTSGATLRECAKTLKNEKVGKIYAFVIAMASRVAQA